MSRSQQVVQATIALIVTIGFFLAMYWAIHSTFTKDDPGNQYIFILLGTLSTTFGAVMQYYFQTGVKKE